MTTGTIQMCSINHVYNTTSGIATCTGVPAVHMKECLLVLSTGRPLCLVQQTQGLCSASECCTVLLWASEDMHMRHPHVRTVYDQQHTHTHTHLEAYLGHQGMSMMNDGLSIVTITAVQLHTPAAQTEHLHAEEGGRGWLSRENHRNSGDGE